MSRNFSLAALIRTVARLMIKQALGNFALIAIVSHIWLAPKILCFKFVVSVKDFEASKRMATVAKNAQWFEDNSPLIPEHKKKEVKGISYKVVQTANESGDASPSTPIGVNLPNNNWIREQHGSKSVSLGNIIEAYNNAGSSDVLEEFAHDAEEIELQEGETRSVSVTDDALVLSLLAKSFVATRELDSKLSA